MKNRNLVEDLYDVIGYVGDRDLSQAEVNAISFILRSIKVGDAERITTEQQRASIITSQKAREYFKKHPNKKIIVVGDIRIPEAQLFGTASYFGIPSKNISLFLEYDKLKKNFPFKEIEHHDTIAVIFGAMPHNVSEKGSEISPLQTAIKSMGDHAVPFVVTDMKVTKEKIRSCFGQITKHICENGGVRLKKSVSPA